MTTADVQAAWARLLIDSLVEAGIRDAVLSPGSRSTPLVLAAVANADLTCRDVMDERAAAFWALGHSKVTQRPVLLICTSGTAGAHYLPAVIEARHAPAPLLVLTADRPVELIGCGANQTIDQTKLFGHQAVGFFDAGAAEESPDALAGLRQLAGRAVATTLGPTVGAVQVNVRLRKPLEPTTKAVRSVDDVFARARRRPLTRQFRGVLHADPAAIETLADEIAAAQRPLIVCGPAPMTATEGRAAVLRSAVLTGAPLLAETASQCRLRPPASPGDPGPLTIDAFDALLRSAAFRKRMVPDLVLQIGAPPTATVWTRYRREHPDARHWVIADQGAPDPTGTATGVIRADPTLALERLASALVARGGSRADAGWRRAWQRAEQTAWTLADQHLAATAAHRELSEALVATIALDALPDGAMLCLGNSLPIRQVDTWAPGRARDIAVWHQRGVSGIDGLLAGSCGAVTAAQRPALAMVGDVSFLHDLGGLATARAIETPFVVLVVDNRGGRIFEQLPVADVVSPETMAHWTTPHEADLGSAAAAWGLPFARCTEPESLRAAVGAGLARAGCSVVVAVVPPHGAVEENRALWAALDERLGAPA